MAHSVAETPTSSVCDKPRLGKSVNFFVPAGRNQKNSRLLHDVASPDDEVKVSKALLQAVVAQGCCPVQLTLMLHRALAGAKSVEFKELPMSGILGFLDRHSLGEISEFLPFRERLDFRMCSQKTLQVALPLNSDGGHLWRLALQVTRGSMREKAKQDLESFKAEVEAETRDFRDRLMEQTEGFRDQLRTETANLGTRIAAVEARTEGIQMKVTTLENRVCRDEETLAASVRLISQLRRKVSEFQKQDAQCIIREQETIIADLQRQLREQERAKALQCQTPSPACVAQKRRLGEDSLQPPKRRRLA